jgi:hypothetical protein
MAKAATLRKHSKTGQRHRSSRSGTLTRHPASVHGTYKHQKASTRGRRSAADWLEFAKLLPVILRCVIELCQTFLR